MHRFFGLAALALLIGASIFGCGDGDKPTTESGPGKLTAVIASSDLAVGKQRFSFVVLKDDEPLANTNIFARFFKIPASGSPQLVGQSPLPWSPIDPDQKWESGELSGLYYANIEFDEPGNWGLGISLGNAYDEASEIRVQFPVGTENKTLVAGDKAVPFDNQTKDEAPMVRIHTGSTADPGFHDLSIKEAAVSGRPSVVVFATPAFCRTKTCGPSLEVAIKTAATYGDRVNFLHVEPYELDETGEVIQHTDGDSGFELGEAALAWRLPTEPWVFVLNAEGVVVSRFDGPFALEELTYVLDQVTK